MARSTDSIGAPNVLASSRAPAQADIEIIDVNSTNNVLIGNPLGFPESYVAIRVAVYGGIMAGLFDRTYLADTPGVVLMVWAAFSGRTRRAFRTLSDL